MIFHEASTEALADQVGQELEQFHPDVLLETIRGWLPGLLGFGYKILIALILFFVGRKVIRLFQRVAQKSFDRMDLETGVSKFLHSLIGAGLNGILIFMIAGEIGIDSASIIALLGSAGLAIGLSIQGSLANFAGGVMILMMRPFRIGDYIITKDGEGTVSVIGLVYTTLMTVDNKMVVIPNGTLANSPMVNVTSQDRRRLDITVGIGYKSDLKQAKEIIYQIYASHPEVQEEESIDVFVDELAASSVRIGARGWVATDDYWSTRWAITEEIKIAFDEAGIEIAFNQLEVHMKK